MISHHSCSLSRRSAVGFSLLQCYSLLFEQTPVTLTKASSCPRKWILPHRASQQPCKWFNMIQWHGMTWHTLSLDHSWPTGLPKGMYRRGAPANRSKELKHSLLGGETWAAERTSHRRLSLQQPPTWTKPYWTKQTLQKWTCSLYVWGTPWSFQVRSKWNKLLATNDAIEQSDHNLFWVNTCKKCECVSISKPHIICVL